MEKQRLLSHLNYQDMICQFFCAANGQMVCQPLTFQRIELILAPWCSFQNESDAILCGLAFYKILSCRYAHSFCSCKAPINIVEEQVKFHDSLRSQKDYKLELFLKQYEELVFATKSYNSWEKMKAAWTKRYRDAIMNVKPNLKHVSKKLTIVDDSLWQRLYRRVNNHNSSQLQVQLLDCCTQLTHKKPTTANVEAIKGKIIRLEQQSQKTLEDCLNIMSFKLLNSFETLTHTEKCVLKLTVSTIINLSKKVYSDQYQKHLPLTVFESLSSLSPPTLTLNYEQQLQAHFLNFRKIIFEGNGEMVPLAVAKRGLKDQICYIMVFMYNKITEWEDENEEDEEDDDDDEEIQNKDRKRKRTETASESDMMMVVKFVLDAVFADTGLKWRSGEKTTSATKRSKLVNELSSSTNTNTNTNTNNIMGRRSDLVLKNRRGVDLCLVEFKNGSSLGDEIAQDSKSLRCTKSLYAYNSALSNKLMWSMNWSGYQGDIYYLSKHEGVDVVLAGAHLALPTKACDVEKLQDTLIELYRFKEQMISYDHSLAVSFTASEEVDTRVYHSP